MIIALKFLGIILGMSLLGTAVAALIIGGLIFLRERKSLTK